jgi:chromate reductase, NAD(P)H dehydrogenase (quinone)
MARLLAISGSLRKASFNTTLLRAAQATAADGVQIEIATLHGIPLYDADAEAQDGLPAAVKALKDKVAAADGVILATPEYNSGVPGVLKNAIDWLSRPPDDIGRVFGNRAFAVLGATPSGLGTTLSQAAWLPILRHLGVRYWAGPRVMVSKAHEAFDANGQLKDEATRALLAKFVAGFAAFATEK